MQNKIKSTVITSDQGDAFWQSGIKGSCITIKASSWNIDNPSSTVFLSEMPKGDIVKEHAHQTQTEIFICLEGEGIITIDGKEFSLKPHDVAYVAPLSKHMIRSTSETPLKFMVIISPGGLEERLKLMGKPKVAADESPPEPFESNLGTKSSHGVF